MDGGGHSPWGQNRAQQQAQEDIVTYHSVIPPKTPNEIHQLEHPIVRDK